MGMVYGKAYIYFRSTYFREREFSSRLLISLSNLEWSVDIDIFNQIFVPDIDLFASRLNAKTDYFVSWHPEPGDVAVDAFSVSWANLKCYAFPPFNLLTQVLAKIRNNKALGLLIAPVWTTQNWNPLLLQLALEQPILLTIFLHYRTASNFIPWRTAYA